LGNITNTVMGVFHGKRKKDQKKKNRSRGEDPREKEAAEQQSKWGKTKKKEKGGPSRGFGLTFTGILGAKAT